MVKFKGYCQRTDKVKDSSSDGVKSEEKEIKLLLLPIYHQNNKFSDTHGEFVKKDHLKVCHYQLTRRNFGKESEIPIPFGDNKKSMWPC